MVLRFRRPLSLKLSRCFHASCVNRLNPLLPIDGLLEELTSDDDDKKKRIKLVKSKPKILIPANADSFKSTGSKQPVSSSSSSSGSEASKDAGPNDNNNNNNDQNDKEEYEYEDDPSTWERFQSFFFKCLETSGITFASLFVLGGAGFAYHNFYGMHVIDKMSQAFDKGDEAFELTMHKRVTKIEGEENWVERPQQLLLDQIISGQLVGRYFLISGEKGCGKSSMILNSMNKVDSFNCAFIDAHSDPEIFRIRLGKALNFAYHEDYIGSLFSIRGPRDTTALLDIERCFNKLEEVAIKRVKKYGRPLVLVINNTQLIKNDEEGSKLIELLQQKAESLSGAGLVTMIFNSDDYWIYERLKMLGTRLEVINVRDFNRIESIHALRLARRKYFQNAEEEKIDSKIANQVYDLIGGRAQHLSEVAKQYDLIKACHQLIDREKTWFLNQCGLLGSSMDDDVNESGKFSTSAMMLMKVFTEMYDDNAYTKEGDHKLPELPLWRARQIMTRNDYIQLYDNLNIFTIDSHNSFVRADSVPMMRAFMEIASQKGFDQLLDETSDRVAEIESLGRTREVVLKDLVNGGSYKIKPSASTKNGFNFQLSQQIDEDEDENNDDPIKLQPTTLHGEKSFWANRLAYNKPSDSGKKSKD